MKRMIAYSQRGFRRKTLIPILTPKIIAQLGNLRSLNVHHFQATIANQVSVALENNRIETVAPGCLVVEIALEPRCHLISVKRRAVKCGHHLGVCKYPQ